MSQSHLSNTAITEENSALANSKPPVIFDPIRADDNAILRSGIPRVGDYREAESDEAHYTASNGARVANAYETYADLSVSPVSS